MEVQLDQRRRLSVGGARAVVDGLTPRDLHNPRIDKAAVEAAISDFLRLNDVPPRMVQWLPDARSARSYVDQRGLRLGYWPTYWSHRIVKLAASLDAAWHADETLSDIFVGLLADLKRDLDRALERDLIRATTLLGRALQMSPAQPPMIDAFAAGLYYFGITIDEVVCIPRPSLWVVDWHLHREDAPAVEWPTGERYFFWHGVRVPDWVIENSERITLDGIRSESNTQRRQCMIHHFGIERFLCEAGAKLIGNDRYGRLWRVESTRQEAYSVVEVENGSTDPDRKRRRHFLCVPPTMQSAHQAVAWTYGLRPEQYEVAART